MKSITIIGNIGSNAVVRMTSDGRQIMTFNVAVNQGENNQPIWFGCVSNYREKLVPYLVKGQCVCVMGELQPRVYNGALDLSISVDKCELCGRSPETNSQPSTQNQPPVESAPSEQSFDAANQQTL